MDVYRLFNCRRCHEQVRICRPCYRGQQFCPPCGPLARRESCREYEAAFRSTLAGKLANAQRQSDHRARARAAQAASEVVTHHGSSIEPFAGQGGPPNPAPPSLEEAAAARAIQPEVETDAFPMGAAPEPVRAHRCAFCGCPLVAYACRPGVTPPRRRRGARPRRR